MLAFAARRVEYEPIAVLIASCEGSYFDETGVPDVWLGGLVEVTAGTLLDARGRQLAPKGCERLVEQALGNPAGATSPPSST
jgi:hypothetical protein